MTGRTRSDNPATTNPPRSDSDKAFETLIIDLEAGLKIDEHALDTALIRQPDMFYRVSQALALAISRRDFAKQTRDELMAELDADIRAVAARHEEKITEGGIKAQLTMDPAVKRAERECLDRGAMVGQLTALKEAFVQRSYVLKDLASLYVANYYSDASAGSRSTEQVKNRAGDDARRAMSEARRSRG